MSPESMQAGVRPGEILAGKYRVERVIGAGGMGVVVAAHHIHLDEKVALKFLLPETLGNPEAIARFVREARAAVKIKSEHVARVSDVGHLEDGSPYMVMEYLEGGDLSAWLKERGALPVEQAVEFVLQACVALAEAHGLGIVHRDLKPANLFCIRGADGQLSIKVLDFGISKVKSLGSSGPGMDMTKTSTLMGTPLYMSPEQMRSSREVDAGTDIWALGVILFELMAGRPPFQADTITELVMKVGNDPPPSLRAFRADASAGIEAVIGKCLEKDRSKRYRNVGDLARGLLPFAPTRSKAAVERISGIIQSSGQSASALDLQPTPALQHAHDSPGTVPPMGRTAPGNALRGRTNRSAGVAVVVGAIAVAGALVGVALLKPKGEGARGADPATTAAAHAPTPPVDLPKPADPPLLPSAPLAATVAALPSTTPPATEAPPVQTASPIVLPAARSTPARRHTANALPVAPAPPSNGAPTPTPVVNLASAPQPTTAPAAPAEGDPLSRLKYKP